MSSFFDELETQLRTAARARVAEASADAGATPPRRRRRRGWSWLRTGLRAAPVLAAAATTVVIAGAALLLFGHGTHHQTNPTTGNLQSIVRSTPGPQLRRELGYITSATRHVTQSRLCRTPEPAAKVTFISGSPGPDLLATLGVLRRHQTAADRLTASSFLDSGPEQVYRGYERRALVSDGVSYYIVAVRQDRLAGVPSDRCIAMQEAALRSYAPKIPPSVRTQTLALQTGFISYALRFVAEAPRDGICLVTLARGGTDGGDCTTVASQIQAGEQPSNDNGTFSAVVPDGVASVTLRFPAVRRGHAASVTASVHGNMYAVRAPRAFSGAGGPAEPTMLWRSAQGRVLRTISPPRLGSSKQACRADPLACLLVLGSSPSESSSSSSSTAPVAPSPPGG
jgi:hypothetical protein